MNRILKDLSIMIRANLWLVPVLAALVTALFYFVAPPPPMHATMSTGAAGGGYALFGEKLKAELAKEGFELKLINSSGSRENAERLLDENSGVNLALMQSGQELDMTLQERKALYNLGAIYQEPLWLFSRSGIYINTLNDLLALRTAVGSNQGGIRMVVDPLLQANKYDSQELPEQWQTYSGKKALTQLLNNELDAAFFLGSAESALIKEAASHPELQLVSFNQAAAYRARLPFLSQIEVPQGLLNLATNQPHQDIVTLGPAAMLMANENFHPALTALILAAAQEVMSAGTLIDAPGTWPQNFPHEFSTLTEAEYFHTKGLPLLQRYLPFRIASLADRYIILVIPLLMLLFPLFKVAGPIYRWRIRARIYRWYKYLRDVDQRFNNFTLPEHIDEEIQRLHDLQEELAKVEVPLSYTNELYELHLHVGFVLKRLQNLKAAHSTV
ncbi:TAXI family TRAP transporter solute-binding subunit [Denitrificimonas sp. JX-1]|uniref:TAXI family TRAP transporter solute-binding subunit n=1 Tax=Denitrificimonas halotolerans TaxID=3098930 RepID=A0ABU5GPG2_9GAMM|nr:TAXI family TRAP transporter solute-binding subunit [Denitrificimonas sp. JX-1]MDY7218889.1 TAXI family TRAP transporter solute-binding subunit [Denitrificimonas sp. JX-1]